jgi:hypothetical protein
LLTLEDKVNAYEHHFRSGGAANIEAEMGISWHGYLAAKRMNLYILGKKTGIPRDEAIKIIWDVQMRGCDLRGSEVEGTLQLLLQNGSLPPTTALAARKTLAAIQEGRHAPKFYDTLRGGPCEK